MHFRPSLHWRSKYEYMSMYVCGKLTKLFSNPAKAERFDSLKIGQGQFEP